MFGIKKEKLITNIIFYDIASGSYNEKADQILEYLVPGFNTINFFKLKYFLEVQLLGIVKLSDFKYEQDFYLTEEQLIMNFDSINFKKYDIKKLTSANSQFVVDEMKILLFNSITSSEKILLQFEMNHTFAILLSQNINENIEFINENTGITLKNNSENSLEEICEKHKV